VKVDVVVPKRVVTNVLITEHKLQRYKDMRLRGGGIKSSAFYAYLPRKLGPECEALCKERGYWS
jgi:hypothetical protein